MWLQLLLTVIVVALFFYFFVGLLTIWMNNQIFKSAKMGEMHWLLALATLFIWPTMIKDTLSGFKDTMALEIGKIVAAKSASNSMSGLSSMMGAMNGGFNNMGGGPINNDTFNPDTIVDSPTNE